MLIVQLRDLTEVMGVKEVFKQRWKLSRMWEYYTLYCGVDIASILIIYIPSRHYIVLTAHSCTEEHHLEWQVFINTDIILKLELAFQNFYFN